MTLTPQQQEAYDALQCFLRDTESSIFILKGYAGTGKTALINALMPYVHDLGKQARLMAPTGRAAQILGSKCRMPATTIHNAIYTTEKVVTKFHDKDGILKDSDKMAVVDRKSRGVDDIQFYYAIKNDYKYDPSKGVIIVDEASMVCSRKTENDRYHFGSDNLLDDLLTFAKPRLGAKIIFVGDPAQLLPVGDNRSAALDIEYFTNKGLVAKEFTLTDVVRQRGDSTILRNAMKVRDLYDAKLRNNLVFDTKEGEMEMIGSDEVVGKVVSLQPTPEIGSNIVICYSNALAKRYNDAIRQRYFPGNRGLAVGDVLLVVHNNYFKDKPLFNGDFVKVLAIKGNATHSAPVWIEEGGEKKRISVQINYIHIDAMTSNGEKREYYILGNLLDSDKPSISGNMEKALYIDLKMRFDDRVKSGAKCDFPTFAHDDPFFNALRVKYGYAITCHKAQGGEWSTAFVDYSGRTGLNDDSLRWNYTATTRAANRLYAVNMPHITPLDKLKVEPVKRVSNMPEEALAIKDQYCSFLPEYVEPFRKAKCNGIRNGLEEIGGEIIEVKALQYCDRYIISVDGNHLTVDCRYNKSGMFTGFKVLNGTEFASTVNEICISGNNAEYEYDYKPLFEASKTIHENMKSICDDHGVAITNVVNHPEGYNVTYYLSTAEGYAYIKFFYDGKQMITHVSPFAIVNENKTFESIINQLSICVSSKI